MAGLRLALCTDRSTPPPPNSSATRRGAPAASSRGPGCAQSLRAARVLCNECGSHPAARADSGAEELPGESAKASWGAPRHSGGASAAAPAGAELANAGSAPALRSTPSAAAAGRSALSLGMHAWPKPAILCLGGPAAGHQRRGPCAGAAQGRRVWPELLPGGVWLRPGWVWMSGGAASAAAAGAPLLLTSLCLSILPLQSSRC